MAVNVMFLTTQAVYNFFADDMLCSKTTSCRWVYCPIRQFRRGLTVPQQLQPCHTVSRQLEVRFAHDAVRTGIRLTRIALEAHDDLLGRPD